MKPIIAVLLLSFTLASFAQAQPDPTVGRTEPDPTGFRAGIKVNPGITFVKADSDKPSEFDVSSDGVKASLSYGVIGEYFFAENYGFSAEIRHFITGVKFTSQYKGLDTTLNRTLINQDYNLQYIEIPVAFKMRTNEIGYGRIFGQVGIVPGFNIKAKNSAGEKVSKDVQPLNMALQIGAGYEFSPGGNTTFLLGASLYNGFINAIDANNVGSSINPKGGDYNAKTRPATIALNLGVLF